jgi:hypothetical protein
VTLTLYLLGCGFYAVGIRYYVLMIRRNRAGK